MMVSLSEKALYEAVEVVNADLPPNMRLQKLLTENLLGDNSAIDSMAVVTLLSELESSLSKIFKIEFDFGENPDFTAYETLGSLLQFIDTFLYESGVNENEGDRP